mmetsp:Transcript_79418/g.125349  ORF Transcript_79418/g.125349 Transcript_79418/m.125349 type:complete len:579 (+) Transcript_79418:38-1774(+)
MELGLQAQPQAPQAPQAPHCRTRASLPRLALKHEHAHGPQGTLERTGVFLLGCAALRFSPSRPFRHRKERRRTRRRGLLEDVTQAVEEVANTAEDALVHVARIPAWFSADREASTSHEGKRKVVILGTGWAAHAIAKIIDINKVDIRVISPRNYFVFTPMLAAAAVGTVEYRSILEHIRSANPVIEYTQGTCESIDLEKKELLVRPYPPGLEKDFNVPYDVLVMAVGLRPSSLGVPGVSAHCLFLKNIEDARRLRKQVTQNFEAADLPIKSDEERQRLLTFVVVGGGPTGCEFCGELSDFVKNDLRRFYPRLAPLVRILLLHRGATLLPSFGPDLQVAAAETLEKQGIEVVTKASVTEVEGDKVHISKKNGQTEILPCGLTVWAAGQIGQDLVRNMHKQLPKQQELAEVEAKGSDRQLFVDQWLRVCGVADGSIIALGDCARMQGAEQLPETAQVAAQQGAFVARLLNREYDLKAHGPPVLPPTSNAFDIGHVLSLRGHSEAAPFRFLDLGRLAYLGQSQAVAELGVGSTTVSSQKGTAAFLLWRSVYIVKQVSFRNRVLVLFDWIKSRIFGRDLTRF